jgi:LPS-assembly lipoprotein
VAVAPAETPLGFAFAGHLTDRLGPAPAPRWRLDYTLVTETEAGAITPDQEIQRYTLAGAAAWRLTELATGTVAAQGAADGFAAYSAIGTTVATRAAERDARDRLARILADEVVTQLLAEAP